MKTSLALAVALSLSFMAGSSALAQSKDAKPGFARIPVVNSDSGRVEAFLELQAQKKGNANRNAWGLGFKSLDDVLGLDGRASLALVCSPKSSLSREVSGLGGDNCLLSSLSPTARKQDFSAYLTNGKVKLGMGARASTSTNLPSWMNGVPAGTVKESDLAFYAEGNVGRSGVVSIAGTKARATLVPAAAMPVLADEWNTQSLRLSGGTSSLRADVVGRVVTVRGQAPFSGIDVGVTWQTPWSGQLSVGAENVVTKGQNPFAPSKNSGKEDSAVPYVRYRQDL